MTRGVDLIVVARQDYEQLQQRLAELHDAIAKIRRGDQEYRSGKTRVISSLAELRR